MKRMNLIKTAVTVWLVMLGITVTAQENVPALFEYVQAPDTCQSLESRSNYVLTHFWDGFDLTKPITADASLLKTSKFLL